MKIKQAHVAPEIAFFKKAFLEINNLDEYSNLYEPAIFFGANQSSDLINKHKGYKVILPSRPNDYPKISNYHKTLFICSENYQLPENVIKKHITPKIKNYDMFKPNTLGDKIYFYSGFTQGNNLWKFNSLIHKIQQKIPYQIITTSHQKLTDYYDIHYLKNHYYDKCFLNINLTDGAGLSTVIELGLMGRKTIFNNPHKNNIQRIEFPNFIPWKNFDDLINIIQLESKKINTIQEPIDAHNVGDEWLDLDFWL